MQVYHATRESFTYLKEFYCGEICVDDRPRVPAGDEPPSPEFLQQLREHTTFRMPLPSQVVSDDAVRVFKSF
jgi:hypothetical protein